MSRKSTSCNQVRDRKGGGIVYDVKGKGKRDGNIRINGVIEGGKRKNVGDKCVNGAIHTWRG